jgi:protein-S-isoprenylcysteine O-methyltransferase Ste14
MEPQSLASISVMLYTYLMLNTLAHLGHSHDMESATNANSLDHCLPIIICAGFIIIALVAVIIYLLVTRQAKTQAKAVQQNKATKKKAKS